MKYIFVIFTGTVGHESYLSTVAPGLHLLKETVISSLRLASDRPGGRKHIVLAGELLPIVQGVKVCNVSGLDLIFFKIKINYI